MSETILSASGTGRTGTIQEWTAPISGSYRITASGAQGGGPEGGLGAQMTGTFELTAGDLLRVLVGQPGTYGGGDHSGGGGSYVATSDDQPLVVAGGGGGGSIASDFSHGAITKSGQSGDASGGTDGYGGNYPNQTVDGGAGFYGNGGSGNPDPAPQAFINGGEGGSNSYTSPRQEGGYGGGGGCSRGHSGYPTYAGGGGYSGGGGSYAILGYGGGGGSFNGGTEQDNQGGVNVGDGIVIIAKTHTGIISGVVMGADGPAQKEVYIYSRVDGSLNAHGLSDSVTGEFSFSISGSEPTDMFFIVVLDKESNKNALVYDQIIAEAL